MDNLNTPNITNLPNIPTPPPNLPKNKRWIYLVAAIAVVVIVVELVWAYTVFYIPSQQAQEQPLAVIPVETPKGASISLTTPQASVSIGSTFDVNIDVASTIMTDGTDLIITYDPTLLQVNDPVFTSGLYTEYPVNKVDPKTGIITLSGISSETSGVLASGNMGYIQFKAIATGSADISIKYLPGATNESNVIETGTGRDILNTVNNLEVNIQ